MPTIAHRWMDEVWNQGREEMISQLLTADCIFHGLTGLNGRAVKTVDDFLPFFRAFQAAFSDVNLQIVDYVEQGDLIAVRCVITARHTGVGLGITPQDRPVDFTGMAFVRVRDGRTAEDWNNFDYLTMTQQIM